MTILYQWALKWGVPHAALADLHAALGLDGLGTLPADVKGTSEKAVEAALRLEAAEKGVRLFRNNVGALPDARGVPVRYGLANESKAMNKLIKSSDWVGWRKRLITPDMVGRHIGQTVLRETKEPGWHYTGTEHEVAQWRFLMMALADGCDAAFCTGVGTL
jgi:hypothetical protein